MVLGVMLDCSRNSVFKPDQVKNFALLISKMGYKVLYLYMEDVYEIKGEEYFGYLRGKYTQDELKDIDDYCYSIGIELVPCIQTLAHLGAIFRWNKYYFLNDIDDILLCDDERTYELIEKMIATVSKIFRSKKVHIGMDEAHKLGKGRFLDKNGCKDKFSIITKHLERVINIVKKYDLSPYIWSDMFFRFANNDIYDCNGMDEKAFAEGIKKCPKGVTPVFWEYYSTEKSKYDKMFNCHKKYFSDVAFAGGAMEWFGYVPLNAKSLSVAKVAMESAKTAGVKNIMVTLWGDGGGQASFYSVLPVLFYYKELADGNSNLAFIKKKFKDVIGEDWDMFMLLDLPNKVGEYVEMRTNPSSYMLHSDYFCGVFDCTVNEGDGKVYKEHAKVLKEYVNNEKYGYIFEMEYRLCEVLADKYELGVKTRKAYQEKNYNVLKQLVENEYTVLPKKILAFADALDKLWFKENKTSGMEIESIRLGGLARRTDNCRELLKRFIETGEKIAELEEPLLDFYGHGTNLRKKPSVCNQYLLESTVNVMSHGITVI